MKTTFIITAATLAGVLLVKLLMNKKEAVVEMADPVTVKRSHHLTDVLKKKKNHNE